MRSRSTFLATLALVGTFALPALAHAAAIPFFGPIIPQEGSQAFCPASWGMLVVVINNIIRLLITLAIVFVAPLMIAWAGFLYVWNPIDPGGIAKAKGILTHTVVGIVIALSGWLIVDAIMVALYNPNTEINGGKLGAWWSLVGSGSIDPCLPQKGALNSSRPLGSVTTSPSTALPLKGPWACDPAVIAKAATDGNVSLTTKEVNTFACLAKPESSCGSKPQNYSWNKSTGDGRASTAYGAFQVTLSSNHSCFEKPVCYQAARVAGPLNCQLGFSPKGFLEGGNQQIREDCMRAAANITCNVTAAACVLRKQGFNAWTADKKKADQQQCINTYAL